MLQNHIIIISTIKKHTLGKGKQIKLLTFLQQLETNSLLFSKCLFFHIYEDSASFYLHQGFENIDEYFFSLQYHHSLWSQWKIIEPTLVIYNQLFGSSKHKIQYQTLMDSFLIKYPELKIFQTLYCSRLFPITHSTK